MAKIKNKKITCELGTWAGILIPTIILLLLVKVVPMIVVEPQLNSARRLHQDIRTYPINAAGEALGLAAEWNQKVVKQRTLNKMWLIGWWIPDEWEEAEYIVINQIAPKPKEKTDDEKLPKYHPGS